MPAGVVNVSLVTPAALDRHVLPQLLPAAWRGQALVAWQRPPAAATPPSSTTTAPPSQPSEPPPPPQQPQQHQEGAGQAHGWQLPVGWLRDLWAFLCQLEDPEAVLQLSSWPVLPVQGGWLASLTPHSKVRGHAALSS